MLKKIVIAIGILVVIVALILVIVFRMTTGIVDVSEKFFAEIQAGNIDHAYDAYVSEEFKAATSKAELQAFLDGSTLSDYANASWDSRSIENNQGELEGSITTSSGGTVPLTITLVKENDEWKILSMTLSQAGLDTETESLTIPDDIKLKGLASESLHNLALAINARDFTAFYDTIAVFWQSQTSPEELIEGFDAFIEQEIDLTGIRDVEPVFSTPPLINDNGFLELDGYFPTQPSMVYFELGYTYEHPDWKLIGINIEIK